MELNEIARRIFGQHVGVILGFVLIGLLSAFLFHAGAAKTYTASARLVLDTPDPKSRAEATSIVDTAQAIATSPSQVRGALSDAHVTGRDPLDVARQHVSIRGLGTSAILQLSVSDQDRRVAAAVANALAERVIRTRLEVSRGELQKVLPELDERIDDLSRRIASLEGEIDSAGVAVASRTLRARRDTLAQQRGILESERVSLLSAGALRPQPSIISRAAVPTHSDPSRWLADAVIGGLLGFILAIGVAALIETLRPTLVGGESLARELDTPLLGTLSVAPDEYVQQDLIPLDLLPLKTRLRLAGEAAGSDEIGLLATDRSVDVRHLARRLEAISAGARPSDSADRETMRPGHGETRPSKTRPGFGSSESFRETTADRVYPEVQIRPLDLEYYVPNDRDGVGVVVVSPTTLKRAELVDFIQLLRLTSVPLLGLITYGSPRLKRWLWL